MKNKISSEVIFSFLLIALAVLFLQPLEKLWMPTMFSTMVFIGFVVVFIVLAIFIWKEKARDEREDQHRLLAGRVGFLVGAGMLVAGIIIQTLRHSLDSWLLVTLCAMVLGKLLARWYSQLKN